jgi:hypothetical protein
LVDSGSNVVDLAQLGCDPEILWSTDVTGEASLVYECSRGGFSFRVPDGSGAQRDVIQINSNVPFGNPPPGTSLLFPGNLGIFANSGRGFEFDFPATLIQFLGDWPGGGAINLFDENGFGNPATTSTSFQRTPGSFRIMNWAPEEGHPGPFNFVIDSPAYDGKMILSVEGDFPDSAGTLLRFPGDLEIYANPGISGYDINIPSGHPVSPTTLIQLRAWLGDSSGSIHLFEAPGFPAGDATVMSRAGGAFMIEELTNHQQDGKTLLRIDDNRVDFSGVDGILDASSTDIMGRIYRESGRPDVPRGAFAFWIDSDDGKVYLVLDIDDTEYATEMVQSP